MNKNAKLNIHKNSNFLFSTKKEKDILKRYINRLLEIGFEKLMRIPTFQAQNHYKRALFWEDIYYKWFESESLLLFKEAGSQEKYIPNEITDRFRLFIELLITGKANQHEFVHFIGMDIIDELSYVDLVKKDKNIISIKFRIIPTPYGEITTDTFSQISNENIHIGLDSILFWNFLHKQRKFLLHVKNAIDMGCGTGIHSLLLKKINPDMKIVCVDIIDKCINYTKLNMSNNGIENDIKYLKSVWFEEVKKIPQKKYNLIICNPPFEWRPSDEKDFQTIFSYGGENYGMDNTLTVFGEIPSFLSKGGRGYILSQTIVTEDNELLILNKIKRVLKEFHQFL